MTSESKKEVCFTAWDNAEIGSLYGLTLKEAQEELKSQTGIKVPLSFLETELLSLADMSLSFCCGVITDNESLKGEFNPENEGEDKKLLTGCEKCGKIHKGEVKP